MTNINNDNSDMQANIIQGIFKAASEGDNQKVIESFGLLPNVSRDCKDKRGWSPLMLATRNGHIDVIKTLLKDGADPTVFNNSGQNALDIASFWNQGGSLNVLKQFLKPPKTPELEFVNFFSHSVVDRQSYKRNDAESIKRVMHSDKAKFVVFGELKLLATKVSSPAKSRVLFFQWNEIKCILNQQVDYDLIYLGVGDVEKGILYRETSATEEDKNAYFAVNFAKIPTEEQFPIQTLNGEYMGRGYTTGITFIDKKESGLIAQARSILAWHEKHLYCPSCGHKTVMGDSGYKRICTWNGCVTLKGAHNTSFPRTDPVVIVLVVSTDGKKCLLGRQSRFPPGVYSCVAGFMEPGETIEDAARREVMEEAGVKVGKISYHSSQPWPFPASLMIGLIGNAVCDDIAVDNVELEDARWFERSDVVRAITGESPPDGLRIPPHTAIAHQLIKSWVKMSSNL